MTIESVHTLYEGFERQMLVTVRQERRHTRAYQVNDHGDGVAVLALDRSRRTALMVRQPRVPLLLRGSDANLLELPGGIIEADGEEASAVREVSEETGYLVSNLQLLGRFWPMPGISTELLSLFVADYSADVRKGPGGGLAHEGEDIATVELPLELLSRQLDSGEITDLRTAMALQIVRLRQPDLFS
jgi:nudix-type nucleoside diphosphatase (YffH/AdpP family)